MLLRFIDGTAYNSGQRLDNVNQAHLVLAGGKLVQETLIDNRHKKIFEARCKEFHQPSILSLVNILGVN